VGSHQVCVPGKPKRKEKKKGLESFDQNGVCFPGVGLPKVKGEVGMTMPSPHTRKPFPSRRGELRLGRSKQDRKFLRGKKKTLRGSKGLIWSCHT